MRARDFWDDIIVVGIGLVVFAPFLAVLPAAWQVVFCGSGDGGLSMALVGAIIAAVVEVAAVVTDIAYTEDAEDDAAAAAKKQSRMMEQERQAKRRVEDKKARAAIALTNRRLDYNDELIKASEQKRSLERADMISARKEANQERIITAAGGGTEEEKAAQAALKEHTTQRWGV